MLTPRYHAFVKGISWMVVVALAMTVPVQSAAQGRDKEQEAAVVVFIHSVSARTIARMCVRGMPAYQQRFDDRHARWFEKYRDWIARGEAVFREELRNKDQSRAAREKLEQVERAVAALATDPVHTSPLTLDDRLRALCEQNLADLEKAL